MNCLLCCSDHVKLFNSLEAERDTLKADLKTGNSLYAKLTDRINDVESQRDKLGKALKRIEAELEEMHIARDFWEVKAEKLANALSISRGQWIHSVNKEECLLALAKFEEGK